MSTQHARSTRLRALVVQHEEPTPPGFVTEWLAEHEAIVETFRIDIDNREVDPTSYDLIVSLGSEFAAFDDSKPFVPREARLMRAAIDADVPVLGLCFGGQLLARVLGGEVFRSPDSEIGWLPVGSEVTTEIMDEWVRVYRHELDADGVDPDALLEETTRRAPETKRNARQLLDRYLRDVARVGSGGTAERVEG